MLPHLAFTGFLGRRIHLGVTGSVAAYKMPDCMRHWQACGAPIGATLTAAAQRFITPLTFKALGADPVYTGLFAADDAVFGHLDPGQTAKAFVIAPATANTLAKLAHGLADDMLSTQALSFPGPLVIAPAMNPRLWQAAATRANWSLLKDRGHVCLEPDCGSMACGEEGKGRLPRLEAIFLHALKQLCPQDMAARAVMVTLGPTREAFDPVRFWSNPSSGVMGASIAVAAWLRGATVHAVCGPVNLYLPDGVARHDVTTAQQMYDACMDLWPNMDMGCCTAAVADFRPQPHGDSKFKKEGAAAGMTVPFLPNPDILAALGAAKSPRQRLIGFAAETDAVAQRTRDKLQRKNGDLFVGNKVGVPGSGFQSPTNTVCIVDRTGREEQWSDMPKPEIAMRIWDWLLQL
ncbi:MAG: bifunctional phosphopantothenoylcysteine decarboxylase/phosphopantothenate--cysteine ligase CoaBC [Desulfovibrionaceae bacterium]